MRTPARIVCCSALLLVPCFWQPRIQAGDLSSHVYNAWLAQLIERGQAPGLALAPQSNNVLFDFMLSALLPTVGAAAAQRIAVSAAVLIFFWGAFGFVWSSARRERVPWHLAPWLAVLAYGWVFHMGLFNFYLSMGLSLGAMALLHLSKRRTIAGACLLLIAAYVAHPLPLGWALAVILYDEAARRVRPRYRVGLWLGALAGIAALAALFHQLFPVRWSPSQIMAVTGADQSWLFGRQYVWIAAALLGVSVVWLQRIFASRGVARTLFDPRLQVCLLCAAGVVIIPDAMLLPGMRHTLNGLAERMSLGTAVMFLGLAATVRPRRFEVAALAGFAALFFGCVYADERELNRVEIEMARLIQQIPPGQRVVSLLAEPDTRIEPLAHLVDRVCVEHCFSYGNYEPSTAQFRVRADRENPFVVWDYAQSWGIQSGGYVVQARDLPLYKIDLCDPRKDGLCIVPLQAGTTLQNTFLRAAAAREKGGV